MKVFVATDVTIRTDGEHIYAREKYATILNRYYDAFGRMILFSRVERIDAIVDDCVDITSIVDILIPMKSLMGTLMGKTRKDIFPKISECSLVIGRCPSISAYKAFDCAKKANVPYFAESMGCAWDAYWNHGFLGKIIAPYMFLKMRQVVKNAEYALYVTSEFLQKRYPREKNSISASNVLITDVSDSILQKRIEKIQQMDSNYLKLMTTAAVNVKYKGQQYVIKAIPTLNNLGIRIQYNIVGEGDNVYLYNLARKYGVEDQVVFRGRLPLEEVLTLLDEIDVYIQPSLQEGLPRSVIEALSRGCLAIGANTAGIPELLDKKFVTERKNARDIANCLAMISKMPTNEKCKVATRNFYEAKKYKKEVLDEMRSNYYASICSDI